MNQREHIETARILMERADRETGNGGNEMIAAEFLWGAFAHCLMTVALKAGIPHNSHGAFHRIAQGMDAAEGGNRWRSSFGSAERLHFHFYHGTLPQRELQTNKQRTAQDTLELLRRL